MKEINCTSKLDLKTIPVDEFWNTGDEKESKMHRIHSYPAKFPAFIATKALHYANDLGIRVQIIADIFCGCGTVAFEAKRNNIDFWGCDINPVATLIAKAKSYNYKTWKLLDYLERINEEYKNSINKEIPYETTNPRIKYWFDNRSYQILTHLLATINTALRPGSKYHTFFLVAFSNILKPSSRWLTKSIKPQLDPEKDSINILKAFSNQCHFSILANEESDAISASNVHIETADFLCETLMKPKADLIITSPPYVTSYEYADLHQLSIIWLNHARDYRDIRKGAIGSHHHNSNFEKDFNGLNKRGFSVVSKLNAVDKSKAKMVAKYFIDMQSVAVKSYSMLSDDGIALFVIGNTQYSDVIIDNANHLVESLFSAGFSSVKITKRKISKKILTPYRDKKGRFTSDNKGRKVYNEEFIITGQK